MMDYKLLNKDELNDLIDNARVNLQQECMNNQKTDISSIQEHGAFFLAIGKYLSSHKMRETNRSELIKELSDFLYSEISDDHHLSKEEYETLIEKLLV